MRIILMTLLAVLLVMPAAAQVTPVPDPCDWPAIERQLSGILSNLDNDPGITLVILQATINDVRIRCASTTYTPDEFPSGIIGPIFLTAPIYEITVTAGGDPVSVLPYAIERRCTISSMTAQPGTSSTTLWRVEQPGCTVMIEVNGGDWELSITPLA